MNGLWVSLLILWVIVESVQYFRKIPFPRRMAAPLVWVVIASGLISLGQSPQEQDGSDIMRFLIGILMGGVFGSLFYGFRLSIAKIWYRAPTDDVEKLDQKTSVAKIPLWKKIFASAALVLAGIALIALSVWGYQEYRYKQEQIALDALRQARQALEDAVVVTAFHPEGGCPESHPYAYKIENKTTKIVNRVDFDVLIRKIGFSKVLNHQDFEARVYSVDKILNPGDAWAGCISARVAGYPYTSGYVTDKDVEFEIVRKYVEFKTD